MAKIKLWGEKLVCYICLSFFLRSFIQFVLNFEPEYILGKPWKYLYLMLVELNFLLFLKSFYETIF